MAQTLDEFVAEVREGIDDFERKYKEKSKQEPEYYPLEMPDDNDGLWAEFFFAYITSGEV